MADPSLLLTSRGTGENNSSDSSAQPYDGLEMNRAWNITNETRRALKTRHLTMIGLFPSYGTVRSSNPSFAQLLVVPSVVEYS